VRDGVIFPALFFIHPGVHTPYTRVEASCRSGCKGLVHPGLQKNISKG